MFVNLYAETMFLGIDLGTWEEVLCDPVKIFNACLDDVLILVIVFNVHFVRRQNRLILFTVF